MQPLHETNLVLRPRQSTAARSTSQSAAARCAGAAGSHSRRRHTRLTAPTRGPRVLAPHLDGRQGSQLRGRVLDGVPDAPFSDPAGGGWFKLPGEMLIDSAGTDVRIEWIRTDYQLPRGPLTLAPCSSGWSSMARTLMCAPDIGVSMQIQHDPTYLRSPQSHALVACLVRTEPVGIGSP
jgi:hypothetical protein